MDLTKEHFEKHLTEQLSKFTAHLVTKKQFDDGLKKQTKELEKYADDKAEGMLEAIDARFNDVDTKFDEIDARFSGIDARFSGIDAKFESLGEEIKSVRILSAFGATKQDIKRLEDKIDKVSKRTMEDSNLFNRKLVQHDKRFNKLEKSVRKIQAKIMPVKTKIAQPSH